MNRDEAIATANAELAVLGAMSLGKAMTVRIGTHLDANRAACEAAKKSVATLAGLEYKEPDLGTELSPKAAAALVQFRKLEKLNPTSPDDAKRMVIELATEATSERLRRDVSAYSDFVRSHPVEEIAAPDIMLKFYIRAAAMLFSGGFNQTGKGVFDMTNDALAAIATARVGLGIEPTAGGADDVRGIVLDSWLGSWFRTGCPRVILKREEAAALALTDMPEAFTAASDIPAPWSHFIITLPPDVLVIEEGISIDRIIMHRVAGESWEQGLWLTMIGSGWELISAPNMSAGALALLAEDGSYTGMECARRTSGAPFTAATMRGLGAAARIAAGVCFALENKRVDGRLKVRHAPPSRVGGLPQTTDYRLGLPIKVDFTEPLREYTLGRAKTMHKVQWVVRGHWRNQAVGKGRAEHRRIWIQPFWKGSAAMPILVRGHQIGASVKP